MSGAVQGNPFAGIYSAGTSTDDISMSDLEKGGKMTDYFSTGTVLGNMDAQNTAQRGKMKSNSLQEAHSEVMKSFLGDAPAFGIELETGAPLERNVGIQGVSFSPKRGPLDPNKQYQTGASGKFMPTLSGYEPDATTDLVRRINAGIVGNPFPAGEKIGAIGGYSGVKNYFAPTEEAGTYNEETLGGTTYGVAGKKKK
jgi:hypothetical protein